MIFPDLSSGSFIYFVNSGLAAYEGTASHLVSLLPPVERTASTNTWFQSFRILHWREGSFRNSSLQPHPPSLISLKLSMMSQSPQSANLFAIWVHTALISALMASLRVLLSTAFFMSSQWSSPWFSSWWVLMMTFRPASCAKPTTSHTLFIQASSILKSGYGPIHFIQVTGIRTLVNPAAFTPLNVARVAGVFPQAVSLG